MTHKLIYFFAAIFLLCSVNAAGQEPEPADSVSISIPEISHIGDSVSFTPHDISIAVDSVSFPENNIIVISDTTDVTQFFMVEDMDSYMRHSPAKAAMMSAVVPGLGQIYNKKYWKLPIVYLAIGISVERFVTFQNQFSRYRRAYIDILDNDPNTNYFDSIGFPESWTMDRKQQYITKKKDELRTWRDWSIVAMVAAYALNIIDANVDAHLMDFNLDDNLSLKIRPSVLHNGFNSQQIGLALRLTF